MALRERAALDILAGQADRMAFTAKEPKASASAVAQSMPSPESIIALRLARKRLIVRWTSKPSGVRSAWRRPPQYIHLHAGLALARIVIDLGL
jgi:hypothetical protein